MKVPILRIPFSERSRQFINDGVDAILTSGELTMGRYTREFEERFCEFSGARFAIACSSGTAALELIVRALEIEDRAVVVPTNTFLATALAVIHAGNRVVFADSDPETLCLDLDDVKHRVTPDTAAVILVHVGGIITPAVWGLQQFCRENRVHLIEDCAHAHGCTIEGRSAGTLGVAGAFSFFPTKVLTTGEGGMVTTNDESIARRVRSLRNHGKNPDLGGRMSDLGHNYRMSEMTALLGVQQLVQANEAIQQRRTVAAFYDARLGAIAGLRPVNLAPSVTSSYYKYPVYLDEGIDRGRLKANLKETHGVSLTGEVYAELCHAEPVWQHFNYCGRRRVPGPRLCGMSPRCGCERQQGGFPGAECISRRHVCLPVYPGLAPSEIEHVIRSLDVEVSRLMEVAS